MPTVPISWTRVRHRLMLLPVASLQWKTGVDLKKGEKTRCGCRSLHLPLLQLLF
jgi:hypothetical protein